MKRILCLLAAVLALAATAPAQDINTLLNTFLEQTDAKQFQQAIETGNKLLPLLTNENDRATFLNALAFYHYSSDDKSKALN